MVVPCSTCLLLISYGFSGTSSFDFPDFREFHLNSESDSSVWIEDIQRELDFFMPKKTKVKFEQNVNSRVAAQGNAGCHSLVEWFGDFDEFPLNWGISRESELYRSEDRCQSAFSRWNANGELTTELVTELRGHGIAAAFELLALLWCGPAEGEQVWPEVDCSGEEFFETIIGVNGANDVGSDDRPIDEVLFVQLAEIELSLCWDVVLPSPIAEQRARRAVDRMGFWIKRVLDHDGMPAAHVLMNLTPLLASWVRCFRIIKIRKWKLDSEVCEVLEWLVQQVLRLIGPNGSLMLGTGSWGEISKDFRKQILKLSNDPIDKHLAKFCFPSVGRDGLSRRELPESSSCSPWGEVALLQSYWKCGLPKLAVDFSQGQNRIELASRVALLAGSVTPEVSFNGKPMVHPSNCGLICWHQDEDLDYLEIEFRMTGGIVIQRQFVLVRQDQILVMLDGVTSENRGRIDYHCRFPLSEGISAMPESETSEVYLKSSREIEALVLPLGLGEWKVDREEGSFIIQEDCLELHQSLDGEGVCASLLFDLNPSRSQRPRTWRRLNVMEKLQQVNRDRAVAYRVQLDRQQWLIYRSIGENASRTFLGENFADDFFMGRFYRNGSVEELIQIEQ